MAHVADKIKTEEYTVIEELQREELKCRRILFRLMKRNVRKDSNMYKEAREKLLELRQRLAVLKVPLLAPITEVLSKTNAKYYRKDNDLYVNIREFDNVPLFLKHGFEYDKESDMWLIRDVF